MPTHNKLSLDEINNRIYSVHGDNIYLKQETYINTKTKACFVDIKHGEWWTKPIFVYSGHGHPNNKGPKRISEKEIKKVCNKLGIFVKSYYYDKYNLKINCSCLKCEHEWTSFYGNIKSKNNSCIKCSVEKREKTNLKKYGVYYPLQNKEVQGKTKQTNIEKYGVQNPAQNREIGLKTARSQTNSVILKHWKTGEELVCIASYERKVVEYLNKNKIDFNWQPSAFEMPNGKTYRPDLYLINENLWAEIKGYFRKDAQEKWDWFHENYPNSELWNKKKLKEMGIL